jgi:PAS domain S-box-containing protein
MTKEPIQILMIEDNPGDARLFREYLHGTDLDPVELHTVEQLVVGLEHLVQNKPDIILLDLGLPDSQGLETFTRVYAQAPDVPIVILTGLDDADQAVEAVKAGAQDYLVKGEVSGGLLARAIRYAIERKQADEMLRHERDFANGMIETAQTIVLVLDTQGYIVRFNPYMEEISGYALAEVQGKDWFTIFLPERNRERIHRLFLNAIGGISTRGEVNPIVTRDGREREIEWYDKTLKDVEGIVVGLLSIGQDITERKQAEEKLAASEGELRALFAAMTDVVIVYGADGRYIKIAPTNPINHYRPLDDMLGKTVHDILPKEQADYIVAKIGEAIQTGRVITGEYTLQLGSKERWFATSTSRLSENTAVWVAHDITKRKQNEKELKAYSEHLEEMVAERTLDLRDAQEQLVRHEKLAVLGQLAGGVGHELRNPLGVINSAIYYLKMVQPDADDKVRQYHAMIEQEVHNAEKIINDLLGFARGVSADREPVSVPGLVQSALSRFPAPPFVEVTLEIPPDLPKVYADPRQMEQVLGNLTTNACQAMGAGGKLTISARQQKEMVIIAVKDTGTGITPENMSKLFEPLFTTKSKGIGLGLAISKKLVEANGGRIEVQSEPGKGSTFTVYLPVHDR